MRIVPEPALWLTLREAAKYAGRSYAWAWERAVLGVLESEPGSMRPRRVSSTSVLKELERERARNGLRKLAIRTRRRPALRLVIDNTRAK
jgi:hypothetical protein